MHLTLAKQILHIGQEMKQQNCPLMYAWHDSKYLGAAHGISGIFHVLFLCRDFVSKDDELESFVSKEIRQTIDFLMTLVFPSGNYPSRVDGTGDKLLQWCHGAPAFVPLFLRAYQEYKDVRYMDAAIEAAKVTWSRGLLKKGPGLCHGVSGNGYVFLLLFKLTRDKLWFDMAWKFAEFIWSEEGRKTWDTPDEPYSLFGGIAGAVCFFQDILSPHLSSFPAFDL